MITGRTLEESYEGFLANLDQAIWKMADDERHRR